MAQQQYKSVLQLSSDPEFVDYANNGLSYAAEAGAQSDIQSDSQTSNFAADIADDFVEGSPMPDEFDDDLSIAADALGEENDVEPWPGQSEVEASNGSVNDSGDDDVFDRFSALDSGLNVAVSDVAKASSSSGDNPFEFSADFESSSSAETDDNNPFSIGAFDANAQAVTADLERQDPLAATLDDPFSLGLDTEEATDGATTFSNASADFDMSEFDEAFGADSKLSNSKSSNRMPNRTDSDTAMTSPAAEEEDDSAFDAFAALDDNDDFSGVSFESAADEAQAEDKTLFMMEPDSNGSLGTASPVEPMARTASTGIANDSSEFSFEVDDESDFQVSNFKDEMDEMGAKPTSFADSFDDFESIPDFDLSDSSAGFTSPSIGAMPSQFGVPSAGSGAALSGGGFDEDSFAASKTPVPMPMFNKKGGQ